MERSAWASMGSSKAAISLLTKTWAAEYVPSRVRVNAVSPGPTRTEGTDDGRGARATRKPSTGGPSGYGPTK